MYFVPWRLFFILANSTDPDEMSEVWRVDVLCQFCYESLNNSRHVWGLYNSNLNRMTRFKTDSVGHIGRVVVGYFTLNATQGVHGILGLFAGPTPTEPSVTHGAHIVWKKRFWLNQILKPMEHLAFPIFDNSFSMLELHNTLDIYQSSKDLLWRKVIGLQCVTEDRF